jgi:hypothetical protein
MDDVRECSDVCPSLDQVTCWALSALEPEVGPGHFRRPAVKSGMILTTLSLVEDAKPQLLGIAMLSADGQLSRRHFVPFEHISTRNATYLDAHLSPCKLFLSRADEVRNITKEIFLGNTCKRGFQVSKEAYSYKWPAVPR